MWRDAVSGAVSARRGYQGTDVALGARASARRGRALVRALTLIRLLDTRWYDIAELARALGVTTRTIWRDIRCLEQAGFVVASRAWTVSETQRQAWRLEAWPDKYDLTARSER